MKALQGTTRTIFLGFFASHVFATLCVDAQAIAPAAWVPQPLADLLEWYASNLNDPLMSRPRELPWFQSLICMEILFQLPFFFWAVSVLSSNRLGTFAVVLQGVTANTAACILVVELNFLLSLLSVCTTKLNTEYSDAFRCACIAYGAHTSTTMAPIITSVAMSATNTNMEKLALFGVYGPYLALPFWIMCLAAMDNNGSGNVAGAKAKSG